MRTLIVFFVLAVAASIGFAQWEPFYGPLGIGVNDFTFGENLDAFAATDQGVFCSTNCGRTWINTGLTEVKCLATMPGAGIETYLFAAKVRPILPESSYVYVSSNNGTSWREVFVTPHTITSLTACDYNASIPSVFAATFGAGVYRSTNRGSNWVAANNGLLGLGVRDLAVQGNTLIAGLNTWATVRGIYKSTDNGESWTGEGLSGDEIMGVAIITDGGGGQFVFAGTASHGVYRSPLATTNWTQANTGLPSGAVVSTFAHDGDYLFAGSDYGLFRSSDLGASWSRADCICGFEMPITSFAVEVGILLAGGRTYFGRGGVFFSSNSGDTWQVRSPSLSFGDITTLFSVDDSVLLMGEQTSSEPLGGVSFVSSDHNHSWRFAVQGKASAALVKNQTVLLTTGHGFFPNWYSRLNRSTNLGTFWQSGGGGASAFLAESSMIFAAMGSVFRSTDDGATWVPASNGLSEAYVLAAGNAGGHRNIFAGSHGVYRSSDWGNNWTPAGLAGIAVSCLAVCPISASDSYLFAANDWGGVYLSTNYGTVWSTVVNGSTDPIVTSFAVCGCAVFMGTWNQYTTTGGIFMTTNNGSSWINVSSGLPDTAVSCLALSDSFLYAGTWGTGVWRRQFQEMLTDIEVPTEGVSPSSFALEQNYPNPFNPKTEIQFSIPVGTYGRTSLRVYDVLGREITTLVNEEKEPGQYAVTFDGNNLASGVYFYRLRVDPSLRSGHGFVDVKKLLLLK